MTKILELGRGTVSVCVMRDNHTGQYGVSFRDTGEPHKIGAWAGMLPEDSPYIPEDKDVVIWFTNIDGLRVFEDALAQVKVAMLNLAKELVREEGRCQ